MLMKKKRHGFRDGVNERPKLDLLKSSGGKGHPLVARRRQQPASMKHEEAAGRKEKTQMVALSDPSLQIFERSRPPLEEPRTTCHKFRSILVRQSVGRSPRINAEPKMDHLLGRHYGALCRRNVIAKTHRHVKKSVCGARSLGTDGVLRVKEKLNRRR